MLENLEKMEMWRISLEGGKEKEISTKIVVTYKGKPITGIKSLSMLIFKRKLDEGGNLLIQDSKLREVN